MHRVIRMHGHADLVKVRAALSRPRGLAGRLDGGDQQRDQGADDQDDDEKLDEREAPGSLPNSDRRLSRPEEARLRGIARGGLHDL